MKCYYINHKEIGKVLIPHCYSVANSNSIKDCCCTDITWYEFENKRYQKTLEKLKKENLELKEVIENINKYENKKS